MCIYTIPSVLLRDLNTNSAFPGEQKYHKNVLPTTVSYHWQWQLLYQVYTLHFSRFGIRLYYIDSIKELDLVDLVSSTFFFHCVLRFEHLVAWAATIGTRVPGTHSILDIIIWYIYYAIRQPPGHLRLTVWHGPANQDQASNTILILGLGHIWGGISSEGKITAGLVVQRISCEV